MCVHVCVVQACAPDGVCVHVMTVGSCMCAGGSDWICVFC